MSIIEEMNADIRREEDRRWEKSRGLLVGEGAGIFFAGQTNPRQLFEETPKVKKRKDERRGR